MKFRVIIIDDEPLARSVIREYLQAFSDIDVVGECGNGGEAVELVNRETPDLIFLDVQMPVMNGFDVLAKLERVPAVIFSTAFDAYALKAFEVSAVDYLLKPYTRERFETAVRKVLKGLDAPRYDLDGLAKLLSKTQGGEPYSDSLMVRKGMKIVPIKTEDVVWIEADDDYATLHTAHGDFVTGVGIGELEKRLNPTAFVRVHRSAIVNTHHIEFLESNGQGGLTVMLSSKHSVKVSRSYAAELRKRIV
jgi:two-component system LytT family response regulator